MRRPAGQPAAASFVPLALAVAVILVVGVVTEMKSRDLARHIQRTGTNIVLEDLRADLEEAVGDQIAASAPLKRIGLPCRAALRIRKPRSRRRRPPWTRRARN